MFLIIPKEDVPKHKNLRPPSLCMLTPNLFVKFFFLKFYRVLHYSIKCTTELIKVDEILLIKKATPKLYMYIKELHENLNWVALKGSIELKNLSRITCPNEIF